MGKPRFSAESAREHSLWSSTDISDLVHSLACAEAEIDRLNTWDGLMSLLDKYYPADVLGAYVALLEHEEDCYWYDLGAGTWARKHCTDCDELSRRLEAAKAAVAAETQEGGGDAT